MNDNEKEIKLETLLHELDRLFDSNKTDMDDKSDDDENDSKKKENGNQSKTVFDSCKEKAFEMLIKVEQLNEELEAEMKRSLIDDKQVLSLFESFKNNTRYFVQSNLSSEFQLNIDLVNSKKRLRTIDFICLNEKYKSYLDIVMRYLMDETDLGNFSEYELIENALIYGPSGSGKLSYLINLLIEKNIINIEKEENKTEMSSKINIYFIDFNRVKFSSDLVFELNFLERLFDSITDSSNNSGVLIILKNIERLFEDEKLERLKIRFVADLIYFMEKNSSRSSILETVRMNKCVIILMSIKPWIMPFGFTRQFRTRINCEFLSDVSDFIDLSLRKTVKFYQTDWLCSECLERFITECKLKEMFEARFEARFLTPKLILDSVQMSINRVRNHIEEKLKQTFENKNLDKEDLDDYKLEYGERIKRRQTLKRNSIRQWKSVQSRLLTMNLTGRRSSAVSSTSGDRRNSSLRRRESTSTQQSSNPAIYDALKKETWKNETSTLLQLISEYLNEFAKLNLDLNEELEQEYKNFSLLLS